MLALLRPLLVVVLVVVVVVLLQVFAPQFIPLPQWLTTVLGIVLALLLAFVDVAKQTGLNKFIGELRAWVKNDSYLYNYEAKILVKGKASINAYRSYLEENYREQAHQGVRGFNYIQLRFDEPPKTFEVTIQPDASATLSGEFSDDLDEVIEKYVLNVRIVDPIDISYRKATGSLPRFVFNKLQELASDAAKVYGGSRPYYTVVINRFRQGEKQMHPEGPGANAVREVKAEGAVVRRDSKALQLQGNNFASLADLLSYKLDELAPVLPSESLQPYQATTNPRARL